MDTRHRDCTITLHKRRCVDRTAQLPDGRQSGGYPETGFGEISGDVRERDFWPALQNWQPRAERAKPGSYFDLLVGTSAAARIHPERDRFR
jgi:hypothetical protein